MQGDFSRLTFSPAKHFSAVLSQQGRVQLDADANESTAILLHYLRTLATDLLGPAAGPAGENGGFQINGFVPTDNPPNLTISPGRYYVDGLLCENHTDPQTQVTYFNQPDAFLNPNNEPDRLPEVPFLVYLLVWERLITAVEDPAIREVALGDQAPDTTARTKIIWQVRAVPTNLVFVGGVLTDSHPKDAINKLQEWQRTLRGNPPQLRARAKQPDPANTDLCITPPQARYRGPENQLYRVEIHTGTGTSPIGLGQPPNQPSKPTFTWSRENGSVVFPIIKINETTDKTIGKTEVFLASMGRDKRLSLEVGDWVEIVDDATLSRFEPTKLLQVIELNIPDRIVALSGTPTTAAGQDPGRHPLLRRWDQREPHDADPLTQQDPDDYALRIHEGEGDKEWIDLEDGIQIQFRPHPQDQDGPRTYWRGDYWLIPARTLTGDVEWPKDADGSPAWLCPNGVRYYVAPLAIVYRVQPGGLVDERCLFEAQQCSSIRPGP